VTCRGPGEDIVADNLSKPLGRKMHAKFVIVLDLMSIKMPWLGGLKSEGMMGISDYCSG
jgi:hypothetical protein